jgi:hypothetical protein
MFIQHMKIRLVLSIAYKFENETELEHHDFELQFEGIISVQALPRKGEQLEFEGYIAPFDENEHEFFDFVVDEVYHDVSHENIVQHSIWCNCAEGAMTNHPGWKPGDGAKWIEDELIPRMAIRGFKIFNQ